MAICLNFYFVKLKEQNYNFLMVSINYWIHLS
jgi:hypothetical protein